MESIANPMLAALCAALEGDEDICSLHFAEKLNAFDSLASMKEEFRIPPTSEGALYRPLGSPTLYFCGNSLGLQPKRTAPYVEEELTKWAQYGVEGHHRTVRPWVSVEDTVTALSARVVGAFEREVAVMGSLTCNLHLLMVPFYRPTATRYKILIEAHAFPSDTYAVKSQLAVHGHNPDTEPDALITVAPRPGEELVRHEDILAAIAAAGDSLALVLWPGIQYYTGQAFDIPALCAAAHAAGAVFGLDLAHAAGNIPLFLHRWDVDFAAWCSYKYLNSGPGGIAGAFVHDKYKDESFASRPYFAGWWGHRRSDRFKMGETFAPHEGATAARLQLSNPAVLPMAALRASLDTFAQAREVGAGVGAAAPSAGAGAGAASAPEPSSAVASAAESLPDESFLAPLRAKSLALTAYLEALLVTECGAQLGPGPALPSLQARLRRGDKKVKAGSAGCEGEGDADADAGAEGDPDADAAAAAHSLEAAAAGPGSDRAGEESGKAQAPITIITPADPERRGCQLSLVFARPVRRVHDLLAREGVVADMREPNVIRVAPVPLYTSASDVLEFVTTLKLALAEIE